jgi:predicted 3-demethylubiquinone-9 3-methyltransferase (glyoxalase superfamily)
MSKITPCLWFDGQAEEAAKFYVSLLPDSRIDKVMRSPADNPSTPAGAVLTGRVHARLDSGSSA